MPPIPPMTPVTLALVGLVALTLVLVVLLLMLAARRRQRTLTARAQVAPQPASLQPVAALQPQRASATLHAAAMSLDDEALTVAPPRKSYHVPHTPRPRYDRGDRRALKRETQVALLGHDGLDDGDDIPDETILDEWLTNSQLLHAAELDQATLEERVILFARAQHEPELTPLALSPEQQQQLRQLQAGNPVFAPAGPRARGGARQRRKLERMQLQQTTGSMRALPNARQVG